MRTIEALTRWQFGGRRGGVRFDIYADSINGDDDNDGLTAATALQTIAAAQTAVTATPGKRLGLARGSYWREQLTLGNGFTVRGYGDPTLHLPRLDCTNVATGWAKTSGRTNVYEVNWAHDLGTDRSKRKISAWENGTRMKWVSSVALCDAEAGTFHVATTGASPTQLVYIHPTGSTDPASNGATYEIVRREFGLTIGADYDVRNVWCSRNGHHDGSFKQSGAGYQENVLTTEGVIHNHWVALGSTAKGCVAYLCEPSTWGRGSATLFVSFDANGAGRTVSHENCWAYSDSPGGNVHNAFYAHTNLAPPQNIALLTYRSCYGFSPSTLFAAAETDEVRVIDSWGEHPAGRPNDARGFDVQNGALIIDNVVHLRAARGNVLAPGGTTVRDLRAAVGNTNGGYFWTVDLADVENSTFVFYDTDAGANRNVFQFGAGDAGGSTRNWKQNVTVGSIWRTMRMTNARIAEPGVADFNVYWPVNTTGAHFEKSGVGLSFANWQAEGQDANSVQVDPLVADALANDWSFGSAVVNEGGRTAGSRKALPRPNWSHLTARWAAGFIGHDEPEAFL
jgi:hypothetical protein